MKQNQETEQSLASDRVLTRAWPNGIPDAERAIWQTLDQDRRRVAAVRIGALLSYEAESNWARRAAETGLSRPGFFTLLRRWRVSRSIASVLPYGRPHRDAGPGPVGTGSSLRIVGAELSIGTCPLRLRDVPEGEAAVVAHGGFVIDAATRSIVGHAASEGPLAAFREAVRGAAARVASLEWTGDRFGPTLDVSVVMPDAIDVLREVARLQTLEISGLVVRDAASGRTTRSRVRELLGRRVGALDLLPRLVPEPPVGPPSKLGGVLSPVEVVGARLSEEVARRTARAGGPPVLSTVAPDRLAAALLAIAD